LLGAKPDLSGSSALRGSVNLPLNQIWCSELDARPRWGEPLLLGAKPDLSGSSAFRGSVNLPLNQIWFSLSWMRDRDGANLSRWVQNQTGYRDHSGTAAGTLVQTCKSASGRSRALLSGSSALRGSVNLSLNQIWFGNRRKTRSVNKSFLWGTFESTTFFLGRVAQLLLNDSQGPRLRPKDQAERYSELDARPRWGEPLLLGAKPDLSGSSALRGSVNLPLNQIWLGPLSWTGEKRI